MRYVLLFQGTYYSIMGLWSILSIETFSAFTGYRGDFFLKHTAGLLFSVLGAMFLYFARKNQMLKPLGVFGLLIALGVMAVEVYYLPSIGNPLPFRIDFGLEGIVTVAYLLLFILKPKTS